MNEGKKDSKRSIQPEDMDQEVKNEDIVWDVSETDKIKSEKLRFKNADDIYDDQE